MLTSLSTVAHCGSCWPGKEEKGVEMLGEAADGDWGLWCQGSKDLIWRGLTRDICFWDFGPWGSHH